MQMVVGPMVPKYLKQFVKERPLLHRLVLPPVNLIRRIREPKAMKEIRRFRRYCRQLTAFVSDPIFVKIGANDGVTSDPCSDILLSNSNWKGLLIEPVPYCF